MNETRQNSATFYRLRGHHPFGEESVAGIFFGLHPAIRAAKLDPVEALAGE